MTEKDMRLRLVVRRDGFPEIRLIWNVPLENDPTISKLLEKVNETIPLEIEQRGLENYVVELHDNDGTSFECLHFQTVRSVLKPDDRVFIRALDRDDNRQRRISGRYQISSDGRHLIDGIPFGRRVLKVPGSRPQVALPPRKRPRLAFNQDDLDDEDDDDDDFAGDEEDTPMLLLTNGDQYNDIGDSSSVRINADFDDADAEDNGPDSEQEMDDTQVHFEPADFDQDQSDSPSDEDMEDEEIDDEDLEDELQDLVKDNADYAEDDELEAESSDMKVLNGESPDKIPALQAAFPSAPKALCEKLLNTLNGDLKAAYNSLADVFEPELSVSAMLAWHPSEGQTSSKASTSQNGAPVRTASSEHGDDDDGAEGDEDQWESAEDEDDEEITSFVRQFDHRGLPPGSITSGKGLAQMAAVAGSLTRNKINGESETTSTTLNGSKSSPEKTMDEDDNTSSDGTSSSSEDENFEFESDDNSDDSDKESSGESDNENSDDDDSQDDSDDNSVDLQRDDSPASDDNTSSRSDSDMDSPSEDSSEDDSEDNGSGPEESSTRLPLSVQKARVDENNLNRDTTSSEPSSDSNTSSEDNSEPELSSESESEQVEEKPPSNKIERGNPEIAKELPQSVQQTQLPPVPVSSAPQVDPVPVPPGAGKESTRKRNARRRAAKRAKKQAQKAAAIAGTPSADKEAEHPAPVPDEKALFEAKRQELLNAIANGGVEVGPLSEVDNSSAALNVTKRKRQEKDEFDQQVTQEATPAETPASEGDESSASVQKKRRVDVGTGRRMIFGALGLRNPKTKEDEEKLRGNLMKGIRPLGNPRLEHGHKGAQQTGDGDGESMDDDSDAWKNKITYRAVECCQEGIVLSEPPFPFVQRWDPQQQGYWSQKKNKRGGQSKRAQRNENHFYQDSRSNKKRKHDESAMWDEEGYDDTFNGIDDTTNADVELNYDDPEEDQHYETNGPTNDASQFTDMDDLPSLPSDLSMLPDLRPGEVKAGMVITWQQWSCSAATGWQPQLSNVTGVVVRIDDDATGVEVCLAKRDRYLDRNEKKYDHNGQRIYDKFEAPDFDDEEEEADEGFRTMGFAEMQQPKILQQPLPAMTASEERGEHVDKVPAGNPVPTVESSTAPDNMQLDAPEQSNSGEPTKERAPNVENPEASPADQGQQASDSSVSGLSQISSPSRQLHESTSQAVGGKSRGRSSQDTSSRGGASSDAPSDKLHSDVLGSGISNARQSSAPLFDSHEDDFVVGTPKKLKPAAVVPPSSVSSAHSGRQPDYTMDVDSTQPDSLKTTDDGISVAPHSEGPRAPGSDEDMSTPTPKASRISESVILKQEGAAGKDQPSSPANPSTPSSLSSINTVWNTARSALSARNTQSSSLSQPQSQSIATKAPEKTRALKDREYEEAMRKLDDFSDDLDSVSRIPDSFKRHSQSSGPNSIAGRDKPALKPRSRSPQIKISPPPTRRRRLTKPSTQFTLPPGTQVIDLSSDSEPVYTENYADDDIDGTYSPDPDSFPKGNGWVSKKVDGKNRRPRNVSAPVGLQSTKRELPSSSQSYHSSSFPTSSVSNSSRFKPRKTSSRF